MFHKKWALLFIMTSLLTFATYIADAQDGPLAIVTEGLVSYWPLDEVKKNPQGKKIIEDIVGDNDGLLQGKQKVVKGKFGNALEFDGQNDFIIVGTNNLPLGNAPVTISAWIFKAKKGGLERDFYIFSYGVWGTGSPAHGLFTKNGKRRLNNAMWFAQGNNGEIRGPEITLKQWQHVTAIYNGANRNTLYFDGVEVGAVDAPDAKVQLGGQGPAIGADTAHNDRWLGLLDEIGIYNRALTPEEVKHNATVQQIFAVEPSGKLSLTWAKIKAAR